MNTIITSAAEAVRYAEARPYQNLMITVDKFGNAALADKTTTGLIYVEKRGGDPTPTPKDIEIAKEYRKTAHDLGLSFIDYIIIGADAYFSFADEKQTELN